MAELNKYDGEPGQTTGGGGGGGGRRCGMEMSYIKSMSGLLKANQIGWSFLAFFISCFGGIYFLYILFTIVVFFGTFIAVGIFVVFAFALEKRISRLNVYLADFLLSIIATISYFAISLPTIILSVLNPLMIASGVFGFFAMAAFFVNIWYSFKRWRAYKPQTTSHNKPYDTNQ